MIKVTPRHNAFVQKILESDCHIISAIRTKTDYTMTEKKGKMVPEKVGLKGITRDGMDYKFTIEFNIDIKHLAKASRDRIGLFKDQPEELITAAHGKKILEWCNSGLSLANIKEKISGAQTVKHSGLFHLSVLLIAYQKKIHQISDFLPCISAVYLPIIS